jgi:hypothetical protein
VLSTLEAAEQAGWITLAELERQRIMMGKQPKLSACGALPASPTSNPCGATSSTRPRNGCSDLPGAGSGGLQS